jgi:hypothetical protein
MWSDVVRAGLRESHRNEGFIAQIRHVFTVLANLLKP